MSVTLYHNPRCSKSREALALLQGKGVRPKIVEYLKTPPSPSELARILKLLGLGPRDIIRKGEPLYRELDLGSRDLDDTALIEVLVASPILIERPIVVSGGKAALGRPPQKVLEIV